MLRRSFHHTAIAASTGSATPTGPLASRPEPHRDAGERQPQSPSRDRCGGRRREGRTNAFDQSPRRRRDEEGEGQIGQRQPPDREVAEAGGDDGGGEEAGAGVEPAPTGEIGEDGQAEPSQRRGEACRGLADTGGLVGHRHEPVEQDRLLEAELVVVVRRQPVARDDHLPGRFRVERLVRISDRAAAEACEKRQEADQAEYEHMPRHAGGFYTMGFRAILAPHLVVPGYGLPRATRVASAPGDPTPSPHRRQHGTSTEALRRPPRTATLRSSPPRQRHPRRRQRSTARSAARGQRGQPADWSAQGDDASSR